MTQRVIMDAGPGINFFSLNKERLLFATLGTIAVPEAVQQEILRKARQDQRFRAAERVLRKVPARLLEVLSDDMTPELATAVSRMSGRSFAQRMQSSRDLGETMVIAHAVVSAEQGHDVLILIDDGGGRQLAIAEATRLKRLAQSTLGLGSISLVSTMTVLKKAAGREHLPDKASMRDLYERLRGLDDGLLPLDRTELMDLPCWGQG